MADILVRGVPATLLSNLKRRATAHRCSLQQELLVLLKEAATLDVLKLAREDRER